jgi:hypothetical protein
MPTPTIDTAIRSQIDQFLVSISSLVRQAAVEAVREALGATDGNVSGSARRGPGRPRKVHAGKPGRRAKRSSADVQAVGAKVLSYIKGNPGSRLEEIGRGLKVDTAGLKLPVQGLLAAKSVRTEGQKRGTKYFAGSGKAPGASAARKAGKSGRRAAKKK